MTGEDQHRRRHGEATVVIIGGGISGICVAIDLLKRNNCRDFVILEKSAGVGGTWLDNKYPGCCCDVWSALYSLSFAQNPNWTHEYPGQEEILAYLTDVAQEYKLYPHFRFNTSVTGATWDTETKKWLVHVSTAAGSKEAEFHPSYTLQADFLVSAVGQLNIPKYPSAASIPGIEEFTGKKMHSARWDWSYDFSKKKIALIGNGCTAVQILPELVAGGAKSVTLFQRTPNWVVPRADGPVSPLWRNIYKYVPGVLARKRATQMDFREEQFQFINYSNPEMAEAYMAAHREKLREYLPGKKDLWEKLTPKYGLGAKRLIISDDYFPTLARENVFLETRGIEKVEGRRILVRDEKEEEEGGRETKIVDSLPSSSSSSSSSSSESEGFDLLICATGFLTTSFLHPLTLTGPSGIPLSSTWSSTSSRGPQALYGITVPSLPNFAMLYGPNTNLGHNSIILMIEAQSRYINALIGVILDAKRRKGGGGVVLRPREDVTERYYEMIQKELRNSVFWDEKVESWYKNDQGVIVNNFSRSVVEYQKLVEKVDLGEFDVEEWGFEKGEGDEKKKVARREGKKKDEIVYVGRVREETVVSDRMLLVMGVVSTVAVAGAWAVRRLGGLQRLG